MEAWFWQNCEASKLVFNIVSFFISPYTSTPFLHLNPHSAHVYLGLWVSGHLAFQWNLKFCATVLTNAQREMWRGDYGLNLGRGQLWAHYLDK